MPKFSDSSIVKFIKGSKIFHKKIKQFPNSPPTVGLALGGGAVWGIAHIGVLKAFERHHIPIHCISGTSIGALVGGLYAAGVSVEQLIELTSQTHWKDLSRLSFPLGGLLSNEPMEKFIYNIIGDKDFSDLMMPFVAVATDLISGKEIVLNTGKLAAAIQASTAIPGIFHPIVLEDHTLVDGGVVNNVPVTLLKEMGARITIAVNLSPDFNNWIPKNSLEVILKSFLIMQNTVALSETAQADIIIDINMKDFNPIDFKQAKSLLNKGYTTGLSAIDDIQALLTKKPQK
ncbi:patatin-like phospholipase family protein [Clostridiaceae bacterium 35-E11]